MLRATVLATAVLALLAVVPAAAPAAPVTLAKVGDFSSPVYVAAPPGDTSRVFVVQNGGVVALVKNGVTSTFADLSARVLSGGERGLLSMAFAPDYATSGLFYVYYTARAPVGAITIEELRADPANPDRADPAHVRTLLQIPHDRQGNHNGGQLQIGRDGFLYAGTGDGGSGGDPSGNAQDTTPGDEGVVGSVNHDYRLGKLLRIDRATGAFSIWSYGLRNPWRFSFDRSTGDLVIGDVGQEAYEEVDFAPAPAIGQGANYGWNRYEGLHTYPGGAPAGSGGGTVLPVIEYPHGPACSITGGYVVRDPALPELAGTYVYGDYCTGDLFGAVLPGGAPRALGLNVPSLSSFGEDGCARVYATSLSGPVYRLSTTGACVPPGQAPPTGQDTRAPAITLLRAATRQHALRTGYVSVRVRCDEQCTLRASGRVTIARRHAGKAAASRGLRARTAAASRALRTRTVRVTLVANTRATLRLRLSRSARRSLARALSRPRRVVRVRISVTASDAAGNARAATRRVQIVR
ncbi:MAG TPA: PQQ-dependent sugar dehydrogenase [Solirubrobacteraceae bacterium]